MYKITKVRLGIDDVYYFSFIYYCVGICNNTVLYADDTTFIVEGVSSKESLEKMLTF